MSRKEIFKALDIFKEKFKGHEGLPLGLLWVLEYVDILINIKKYGDTNKKERV